MEFQTLPIFSFSKPLEEKYAPNTLRTARCFLVWFVSSVMYTWWRAGQKPRNGSSGPTLPSWLFSSSWGLAVQAPQSTSSHPQTPRKIKGSFQTRKAVPLKESTFHNPTSHHVFLPCSRSSLELIKGKESGGEVFSLGSLGWLRRHLMHPVRTTPWRLYTIPGESPTQAGIPNMACSKRLSGSYFKSDWPSTESVNKHVDLKVNPYLKKVCIQKTLRI